MILFPAVKQRGHEASHSLPSSANVKNSRPLTFKNRASYIYRTGIPLPSRCCILYFFQQL